jgi:hypothetical protein
LIVRIGGMENKQLKRERVVIPEHIAANSNIGRDKNNGVWYEVDEEATKEYHLKCAETNEIRKAAKLRKKEDSIELIKEVFNDAAVEVVKKRGRKKGGSNEN